MLLLTCYELRNLFILIYVSVKKLEIENNLFEVLVLNKKIHHAIAFFSDKELFINVNDDLNIFCYISSDFHKIPQNKESISVQKIFFFFLENVFC